MNAAFKYVRDHGITFESEYPYKAKGSTCKTFTPHFKNQGFNTVTGCDELYNALIARPVSIGVDANNWSKYSSGIFNNCGTRLDHGVLLVGATEKFWTVKNSWGASWG